MYIDFDFYMFKLQTYSSLPLLPRLQKKLTYTKTTTALLVFLVYKKESLY